MTFKQKLADFPVLETNRLLLHELTERDASDYFVLTNDPDVTRYNAVNPLKSIETATSVVTRIKNGFNRMDEIVWGIALRGESNIIGTCTLRDFVRSSQAELTYKLHPEHRKHGFMTEALREVLRFAFEEACLHRVQAKVMQHNTNSINVLKKLNFQEEGLLREYAFGNTFADVLMFSMLKSDYDVCRIKSQP